LNEPKKKNQQEGRERGRRNVMQQEEKLSAAELMTQKMSCVQIKKRIVVPVEKKARMLMYSNNCGI